MKPNNMEKYSEKIKEVVAFYEDTFPNYPMWYKAQQAQIETEEPLDLVRSAFADYQASITY